MQFLDRPMTIRRGIYAVGVLVVLIGGGLGLGGNDTGWKVAAVSAGVIALLGVFFPPKR
jgi:hypothetical protein